MGKEMKSTVKKTFVCDDSMVITIPLGGPMRAAEERLMPETFQCLFKDFYKVFAMNGRPKPLGAAQAVVAVFILGLGLFITQLDVSYSVIFFGLPCTLFVVSGVVSYAAGTVPNIHVAKLSFSLNIISFFWSVGEFIFGAVFLGSYSHRPLSEQVHSGLTILVMVLLVVENLISLFLIYWLSKAVCKTHFNTLPTLILKKAD